MSFSFDPWGKECPLDVSATTADEIAGDEALRTAVADLLCRKRAREVVAEVEERRHPRPAPDAATLAEILARPTSARWRIEGLLPSDGRLLLSAQRKTGKTTAVGNLARSLLTGEPFLDRFPVEALDGRVVALNYEVTGETFARWMDDIGVPPERMYVLNLRGRRNLLADEEGRAELVDLVRAAEGEVLVVDPFGRAFTGKSQNDTAEVTPWLVRLDEVAEAAGCAELILTAHAGWDGERTRGSSSLEDWPDVIATMTRDAETDARFLRAEGRDVEIEEDRLDYDPATRRLSLSGAGSRRQVRQDERFDDLVAEVTSEVRANPGVNGSKLGAALRARGVAFQKGDERKATARAVQAGLLRFEPGLRGAKCYFPSDLPRPAPDVPRGARLTYPDPPFSWGGRSGGDVSADLPQEPSLPRTTTQAPVESGPCVRCTAPTIRYGEDAHPLCSTCRGAAA